jgi:molybdopterin/thiamine biosynthesis adenylyltransferase
MENLGLLEDAARQSTLLSTRELELYDRQILFFSQIDRQQMPGFEYQERLKSQRVGVFGLGGWGNWTSLNLALNGFGYLRLVDGDVVELSNLNRQVLFRQEHIGLPKVHAAAETLRKVNPYIEIESTPEFVTRSLSQIQGLLDGLTLIFLGWANFSPFMNETVAEAIHAVAFDRGIPIIEFGGDPFDIFVGPVFPNDGESPCLRCVKDDIRHAWYSEATTEINEFRRARFDFKFLDGNRQVEAWQSSSSLCTMAGMAVDQGIKLATRCEPPFLRGKRFQLSLQTYKTNITEFRAIVDCTWCKAKAHGTTAMASVFGTAQHKEHHQTRS